MYIVVFHLNQNNLSKHTHSFLDEVPYIFLLSLKPLTGTEYFLSDLQENETQKSERPTAITGSTVFPRNRWYLRNWIAQKNFETSLKADTCFQSFQFFSRILIHKSHVSATWPLTWVLLTWVI